MIAPVVVWNARHGWVSFAFQGGRGAPAAGLKPVQFLVMALGQIAYLSPWLFAPLAMGLVDAWRKRADERRLFLLCLALPPILVFTLTPLWGGRGQPHWTMPGWFFVFALMGAWVEDRRRRRPDPAPLGVRVRGPARRRGGAVRLSGRDRLAVAALAPSGRGATRPSRLSAGAASRTRRRCGPRRPSFWRPNGRTPARSRSRSGPMSPCS